MNHHASAAMLLGLLFSASAVTAQDLANGEAVFKICRACHEIGPESKNKLGPMLTGIIGRKAGTIEGFKYSPANLQAAEKGLIWTEDNLFKYLEAPRTFIPGTTMVFAGIKDEADRKDLIAFLKSSSK